MRRGPLDGHRNPCNPRNPSNLGNLVTFYLKKNQQTGLQSMDGHCNPRNSGNLGNLVTFYKKYEEKNQQAFNPICNRQISNPDNFKMTEGSDDKSRKDSGVIHRLHTWSRGIVEIVSVGGIIEYWAPIFERAQFRPSSSCWCSSLLLSLEFMDWHLQWENVFLQITRQRLVGSWWFFRQTSMKFWFWYNGEKISPLACLQVRAHKIRITKAFKPLGEICQTPKTD